METVRLNTNRKMQNQTSAGFPFLFKRGAQEDTTVSKVGHGS